MIPLPAPITSVVRTKRMHPSSLAHADECLLGSIYGSCDGVGALLPAGVPALLGTAFHKLLSLVAAGRLDPASRCRAGLRDRLHQIIEDLLGLSGEGRFVWRSASSAEVTRGLAYRCRESQILNLAESLVGTVPRRQNLNTRSGVGDLGRHSVLSRLGPEVPLASDRLEMAGRADRIRLGDAGQFIITEYKTGKTVDGGGELICAVRTQLELYALLLLDHEQCHEVALEAIGWDRTTMLSFAGVEKDKRLAWLHGITGRVPRNTCVALEGLARSGPHCFRCAIRPSCPAYLASAPRAWVADELHAPWPYDTWGTVRQVESAGTHVADVVIEEPTGRAVRIDGVLAEHFDGESPRVGRDYSFFGLHAYPAPTSRHAPHQPLNYYELPRDKSSRPAYAAVVFRGQPTCSPPGDPSSELRGNNSRRTPR